MYFPYCVPSVCYLELHFYHQNDEVYNKEDSIIVAQI